MKIYNKKDTPTPDSLKIQGENKNGATEQPPRIEAQEQIYKNITRSEKWKMETLPNIGASGFFLRVLIMKKINKNDT